MNDKDFYNIASSEKLGWKPEWFGVSEFDEVLIKKVIAFQKEHDLKADGLVGPTTYRRIYNEREAEIEDYKPFNFKESGTPSFIIYNNDYFEIDWPKVILPFNHGGLKMRKGYKRHIGKRKITNFVNHWDVCLNSRSCQSILDKRGISVHFLIDNDGTIYQTLALQHAAFHAGNVNRKSVGVEITNAYYPKYQSTYVRKGFGERPLVEGARVHFSALDPFLGFYPVQIDALKALWSAVHSACDVPLETPLNQFGKTSTVYEQKWTYGKERGFVSHYHVNKKKIDCAGLDIKTLLSELDD